MLNGNQVILSFILQAAQFSSHEIRNILRVPICVSMQKTLKSQLSVYHNLEQEALSLAKRRNWMLEETNISRKILFQLKVRLQLIFGNIHSKAAEIIIKRNTKNMISAIRIRNDLPPTDYKILMLHQKLLDNEVTNIRHMQEFL